PALGARAVALGLVAGSLTWLYALAPTLLPGVPALQGEGPFGLALLAPRTLFGLGGWSELARALCASLAVNLGVLALASQTRWARTSGDAPAGALARDDLAALAARFLPRERVAALLGDAGPADAAMVAAVEHELAA